MAIRRLDLRCDCLRYFISQNSTGDWVQRGETCGKPLRVVCETELLDDGEPTGEIYQVLHCGHSRIIPKEVKEFHSERNVLWDNLLEFQKETVVFAEKAPRMRFICRHEMGLGKTPISLSIVRENHDKFTANGTKYCVMVVLPGAVYQWEEEIHRWFGLGNIKDLSHMMMLPQIVVTSGQILSPLSKVIVIPWSRLGDKKIQAQLKQIGIASMVVDECHFFKHTKSKRTQALLELAEIAGPDAPMIFLSGTLVENRITEMQVALHLCDPQFFSSWYVIDRMCLHDERGKAYIIHPAYREKFFDRTSKYMLGYKKADVNIPLPPFDNSQTIWLDPSEYKANEEFAEAYNQTLDDLQRLIDAPDTDAQSVIGLMQQLRHWTGKMKILGAAVWIDNWMTANPGEKLCVGVHHISVRETLAILLKHRNPLQMSSEDAKEKDEIERGFRNGKSNLLIASILSAGVGRNMQFCKNAVILERQWNNSREEQFEQRFWRIVTDSEGRVKTHFTEADKVTIYRLCGKGTFDEYFDPMIHLKGIIVDSSEDGTDEELPSVDFIMNLAREVLRNRINWVGV